MHVPKDWCEDHFHTIDPKTNARGIHIWPFDPSLPVDVRFLTSVRSPKVRMNRHDYFKVLIVLSGTAGSGSRIALCVSTGAMLLSWGAPCITALGLMRVRGSRWLRYSSCLTLYEAMVVQKAMAI